MAVDTTLTSKRDDILRIAAKHGARHVRVFGSFANGEPGPNSDVDLLVELDPDRTLLDHVALKHELEDLLGRTVDIVEPEGLHWYIRDRVIQAALAL